MILYPPPPIQLKVYFAPYFPEHVLCKHHIQIKCSSLLILAFVLTEHDIHTRSTYYMHQKIKSNATLAKNHEISFIFLQKNCFDDFDEFY